MVYKKEETRCIKSNDTECTTFFNFIAENIKSILK